MRALAVAALVAAAPAARAVTAPEFQVNGYTWGSQTHPVVAADASGSFVVVWEGTSATDSRAVVARRHYGTGAARGEEFVVNSALDGIQDQPALAVGPNGDFVVAWETDAGGAHEGAVAARRFGADGQPLGGEFVVSTAKSGYQGAPALAHTGDGGFIVAWASERIIGNLDVVAQRFDAVGRRLGDEIIVNTHTPGIQSAPAVASTGDGGFVAVWQSWANEPGESQDGSSAGVFGQRFGADGKRLGREFQVNTTTSDAQRSPDVAVAANGAFVVTWESSQESEGPDIAAQRFNASGVRAGGETRVNAFKANAQQRPKIAAGKTGDWLVTWESLGRDDSGFAVAARRLTPNGKPERSEFVVNTFTSKTQYRPEVAAIGGRYVVTWASLGQDRNNLGVYARLVGSDCVVDITTLCLAGGRFEVRAAWATADGSGIGNAIALSGDTGFFSFFDPSNVEVIVKVLDGCGFNDRFWVFAAGLTDVDVRLEVTDTATGETREYANERGTAFRPIQDTVAFASCGAEAPSSNADAIRSPAALAAGALGLGPLELEQATAHETTALPLPCAGGDGTLCLGGGRFAVSTTWRTANGEQGAGHASPLTADTGTFWFFSHTNVELVVKTLDGCGVNQRYWIFAAGLTDVEVTLTVTDTKTGATRTYVSTQRRAFDPVQDTNAFSSCG